MSAIVDAVRMRAVSEPGRIAVDTVVGEACGYARLNELVAARAAELAVALTPGRAVAAGGDHGLDAVALDLAMMAAELPHLSLPSFFTPAQEDHARTASGAQAEFRNGQALPLFAASVDLPQGTARITFTSGSTGTPKGICLSAQHLAAVAGAVVSRVGAGHAGRHLAVLPPGILLETVAGLYATLLAGGTYVAPPQALIGMGDPFRPDFAILAAAVRDLAITSLILVPEYLAGLVAALEARGERLPRLTLLAVGGARCPAGLIDRARSLGLPVRQGYGLTECGSVATLQDADDGDPTSVGRSLPHLSIIVAPDGEILIDGPLCLGAIGGAAPTAPYATGDLGRIDEAGRLHIDGRKANLIVTSFGRNVSPEWVEEVLLAQPAIIQAVVHGDGLPAPEALIVSAGSAAQIDASVAAANAHLPAYARVSRWRPAAPFTPANGQLTGNGRPVRAAITAAYLAPAVPFFTELEVATWPDRLRFLAIPQVQAGLSGRIGIETYRAYLGQAYHHVRHTVPLMREARARLTDRPRLVAALDEYIAEETGHEEWILSDIAAAGGDAGVVRVSAPDASTAAMVDHAYRTIREGNPAAFFGMVYVLESVSIALATRGASAVAENLGLPPEAFTYLTSHGALDKEHLRFFERLVNGIASAEDRAAITAMAKDIFALFGGVFAAIPLEFDHAAA